MSVLLLSGSMPAQPPSSPFLNTASLFCTLFAPPPYSAQRHPFCPYFAQRSSKSCQPLFSLFFVRQRAACDGRHDSRISHNTQHAAAHLLQHEHQVKPAAGIALLILL
eukprot:1159269-Pelagomonas_calceolata.AAC.3